MICLFRADFENNTLDKTGVLFHNGYTDTPWGYLYG